MAISAADLKKRQVTETPAAYGVVFAVIILISFVLELFVFNYKWICSAFDKPIQTQAHVSTTTFTDINETIKYIRVEPGTGKIAHITVTAKDEASANGVTAPEYIVLGDIERSQYIRLHFSGKIKELSLRSDTALHNVVLNVHVPLMFSWVRFILIALILMTLFVIRPGSSLYKYKTDLKKSAQRLIAAALILVQATALFGMIHWNTAAINWHKSYEHHRQYYALVDSIKHGHFYIGEDNGALSKMENPYDKSERDRIGVDAKWDHAFRDGRYYVYFGVVPVLLLYLPYNLVTGKELPNYIAEYILCLLTMIGIMLLLWEIIKKWFRNTPFVVYLILSVVYGAVSVFGYAVYKPDLYLVPGTAALMLGIFGLALWLSAEKDERLVNWRLAFGSACIALTAGCRPQLTITAFLGVMLFWDREFNRKLLFHKSSMKATVAVCLPFVIVAAGLMWYNAARFGSPFDFGANYNLTTNDMTHRGFVWGRTGLGLFSYLFQPIKIDAVFPFLSDFSVKTTYQGLTLTEMMIGGVFCLFPILVPGLYGTCSRSLFSDKRAYRMVCMAVLMTAVVAVMDAQMAGLLTRYFTDFVWLLMLASSITIFALLDRFKENNKPLLWLIIVLASVSVIMVFLRVFAHSEDSIADSNPMLYYNIERLVAFWM
ncbi:MAG: hypothetical protein IJH94_04515 [Clostridia bacterium]|nr:hypothetical protein [Clostridia bacterium]